MDVSQGPAAVSAHRLAGNAPGMSPTTSAAHSLWLTTAPATDYPSLESHIDADVAVARRWHRRAVDRTAARPAGCHGCRPRGGARRQRRHRLHDGEGDRVA